MKFVAFALTASLALAGTLAVAQTSSPGGPAATSATGDPAASSTKGANTTTTGASRSGSGTSTSGGRDDNGDQGRDAMPDSSQSVRPLDKQNKR
jgi:hypothetical protein